VEVVRNNGSKLGTGASLRIGGLGIGGNFFGTGGWQEGELRHRGWQDYPRAA